MALPGRIEGRKSADGQAYVIRQGDTVLKTIPISEAVADMVLAQRIKQNKWEPL